MASRRITLVADQILGYFRTGGLGTATTFLALALARMGHDVEVLHLGDVPSTPVDPEWTALYEQAGIRIRQLPRSGRSVAPPRFALMRDVELALDADPPDVVVVQDLGAPGYSALRLRRLGLAFENTLFVVFCHGSRQWIANMSRKVRVLPGALAVSRLEQASVELADIAVSPSAYMVGWMREQGWQLPERTVVIPLVTRTAATGEAPPARDGGANGRVDRIVFFGRLEERKGVKPFVAGLNALPEEELRRVDVEFLGRPTKEFAPARVEALLTEGTRSALRSLSFETDLDQHEALARLGRPGTLAVMPSLEDNSPNVVYECLERNIPFLASAVGGTSELVAPEDRPRVLFEPTAEGVAGALRRALEEDAAARPARAAFDEEDAVRRWAEVLETEAAPVERVAEEPVVGTADSDWVLLIDEQDRPDAELVSTLARAQAATDADVVTCGLRLDDGTEHFFSGEPGGLGVLGNDYGTVALVRRSLVDDTADAWLRLGRLSLAGARIVSVPLPLVTRSALPEESLPATKLRVVEEFERALPGSQRHLARLAAGLAAETPRPPRAASSIVRRVARRVLRGRR